MRRILIWVLLAVAAGAGVWTAGWFIGRGAVDERIAQAEQRLEAEGWTLSYGARQIGGFPFDYVVTLRDIGLVHTEGNLLIRVPRIVARQDAGNAGRSRIEIADGFRIDAPISEARRQADPSLPPILRLTGSGDGIVLTVDAAAPESGPRLTAAVLSVEVDQEDYPFGVALTLESADLGPGEDGKSVDLAAGSLHFRSQGTAEDGSEVSVVLSAAESAIAVAGASGVGTPLRDVLYGGAPGTVRLDYDLEGLAAEFVVTGEPGGNDGRYVLGAARATGRAGVTDGLLDMDLSSTGAAWGAEAGFTGGSPVTAEAATAELALTGPMVPSAAYHAGQVRVDLGQVTADDAFWAAVDPSGTLPRDPASLSLDLGLTLRLMARIDRLPPGMDPPYQITQIAVNRVAVSALGASASAEGDIEIVQPVAIPTGTIAVQAAGLAALVGHLRAAELIDPGMAEAAGAILEVYARPGEEPDSWTTEVSVGEEGLRINGQPIQ